MPPSSNAKGAATAPEFQLDTLYTRPGFLFRRMHQIAVGIFIEECSHLGLTPPQHSILHALACHGGLSQADVARALGFDRATTGQIIAGLETRGLLARADSVSGKRRKVLVLTQEGKAVLRDAAEPSRRATRRLLSPLNDAEREMMVGAVLKMAEALNSSSRTPMQRPEEDAAS